MNDLTKNTRTIDNRTTNKINTRFIKNFNKYSMLTATKIKLSIKKLNFCKIKDII